MKVGDVVRMCGDPINSTWVEAGIRDGSVGVVCKVAIASVWVRWVVAPDHPRGELLGYSRGWRCNKRHLEVLTDESR